MFWKTTALLACAALAMGFAPKPAAPKAPAATPAPAPAKPAATPKAVAPLADFDARNPASVMALLKLGGAKSEIASKDADTVLVSVTSVAANFTLLFASCNTQGRACKAVQFDYMDDRPGPTFAQVNAFNQTSALCRSYEDKTGKAHVVYSTLLFDDDPYEHFRTQTLAWTGCIGDFRNFLKDPNGYLASAP
ncbi:MAG TPA: hypothetical protein VFE18_16800 [Phenylobacterium sp.]|jgi:hypothetical protein|uniref:hypothetical protein n=1 Tax=Phenylobacterium sp. TaxID=1871053 RepID=UPI002D5EC173|nr:hypothetical protein [Phenylobacterium sp.]HZZ69833.1 hypothetical protein [Phenylobacterium sp.]